MNEGYKPLLVITMGDAAGSGPEIVSKALVNPEITAECRPIVVGDAATMAAALEITQVSGEIRPIDKISEALFRHGVINIIEMHNIELNRLSRGRVDPMAGKAAFEYIKLATELALAGECDAIVTSAISKEALNKAGYHYNGHTELLAELCGARDVAMMLVSGQLRITHVNTHVSLRQAVELIQPDRILAVIKLTDEAIRRMGINEPRIAVAGLNPHAGENGLFGDEELKYIAPAVEAARCQGINASGPFPPDTVFLRTLEGQFDGAVAMYHDQGHIAIKMLGIVYGVNVTLGLPITRTSVDHGTVFDKAGKGTADPQSLIEAIKLASIIH